MTITTLSNENYKEEIKSGRVVVDFYATWCGPCKMALVKLEELSKSLSDIKFCKADVDVCTDFVKEVNISNVPTFIEFQDGKEIKRGGISFLTDLN